MALETGNRRARKPRLVVGLVVLLLVVVPGVLIALLVKPPDGPQEVAVEEPADALSYGPGGPRSAHADRFELGFETGVAGYWRPQELRVEELPLDLGDGSELLWWFLDFETNHHDWHRAVEDGPKEVATVRFSIPGAELRIGKTLRFRLRATIERPLAAGSGDLDVEILEHERVHEFIIVQKLTPKNHHLIKAYKLYGLVLVPVLLIVFVGWLGRTKGGRSGGTSAPSGSSPPTPA